MRKMLLGSRVYPGSMLKEYTFRKNQRPPLSTLSLHRTYLMGIRHITPPQGYLGAGVLQQAGAGGSPLAPYPHSADKPVRGQVSERQMQAWKSVCRRFIGEQREEENCGTAARDR